MTEPSPAETASAASATDTKPAAKPKRIRTGPNVRDLIVNIVSASEERSGVSLPALKKALAADGYDVEKNNSRIKISIKSLVENDILIQTKGFGVCGSFKLNKKQSKTTIKTKPAKKAALKAKKPAKKPKTAAAKKSPKKVKKPAAKKSPKSPKKRKKTLTKINHGFIIVTV
ncbi:hypothetical protein R3I93_001179 [Phoxinus phoxinus]|uniref:Histone H1 n=1 Tax=Phoxinus phoxinus TaxID=58324 RepID=A0AAN9HIY2_9TELE